MYNNLHYNCVTIKKSMKAAHLQFNGFDWDLGNTTKIEKRVSRSLIEELFMQELLIKTDDRNHHAEVRYIAIGLTNKNRYLFVAFTWRVAKGARLIRPISARYMHQKEKDTYEREYKKIKDHKTS